MPSEVSNGRRSLAVDAVQFRDVEPAAERLHTALVELASDLSPLFDTPPEHVPASDVVDIDVALEDLTAAWSAYRRDLQPVLSR